MEKWKPVINGNYEVSNKGGFRRVKDKKELSIDFESCPYCKFTLNGKGYLIHRLVAQSFIPNPKNKKFVNHKNGIKKDNRVENIEWCTRKENENHAFETGLKNSTGSENVMSKLDESTVLQIKKRANEGAVILAKEFGVHRATIQRIFNGKIWCHVAPDMNIEKRELPKGSNKHNSKLNEDQAKFIKNSNLSYKRLSKMFGISDGLVGHIKNGRAWTHIN